MANNKSIAHGWSFIELLWNCHTKRQSKSKAMPKSQAMFQIDVELGLLKLWDGQTHYRPLPTPSMRTTAP